MNDVKKLGKNEVKGHAKFDEKGHLITPSKKIEPTIVHKTVRVRVVRKPSPSEVKKSVNEFVDALCTYVGADPKLKKELLKIEDEVLQENDQKTQEKDPGV
jgi:hypothetical protein